MFNGLMNYVSNRFLFNELLESLEANSLPRADVIGMTFVLTFPFLSLFSLYLSHLLIVHHFHIYFYFFESIKSL